MERYLLKANVNIGFSESDGYYTGKTYIFQGAKYALVERDIALAKKYTTYARALNAVHKINGQFENYTFEVARESELLFE